MTKTAKDYPVTEGYGYDPDYPLNTGYHRGIDYGCPVGTPVVVNGVQIGLSGATGYVTGPHLHVGRFVAGKDSDPGNGGFDLKAPVLVTTVYSDAADGNYIRLTDDDGVQWVYLHLSHQDVTQGQELKGEDMPDILSDEGKKELFRGELHREPSADWEWQALPDNLQNASFHIRTSPEYMTQNHIIEVAYPSLQQQIADLQKQNLDSKSKAILTDMQKVVDEAQNVINKNK